MAIAVNGGHVSRALDFYKSVGKYFIIGGTQSWDDETAPPAPSVSDYKLNDVIGLKKVDNIHLVVPDEKGTIQYRSQNWRIVSDHVRTTVSSAGVTLGSTVVPVTSVAGLTEGAKLRINNAYEGTIQSISGLLLTLDTPAPVQVPSGSPVLGGAMVEGAKYVYVDCYLNYDEFPLATYRQIGLCTGVLPNDRDVLRSAIYTNGGVNEYTDLGNLEILDNRAPSPRDSNQREQLSLIIEF